MRRTRKEEHQKFFSWLFNRIKEESIKVVIVAGDIFDTGTPPNYALELYYNFLKELSTINSLYIIIIAGNHDSTATLKASKQLLEALNIYVITSQDSKENQLIPIYSENGLEAIVCAVPFLHDSVVRKAISAKSIKDNNIALNQGIREHYIELYNRAIELRNGMNIPIVATGHLTVVGTHTSESERDIYISDIVNISSNFWSQYFDYMALGHLHMNQKIGSEYIRYSGSPIPLSFSEATQEKSINIISFEKGDIRVKELAIPLYQKLLVFTGDGDFIKKELNKIKDKEAWIKIHLKDNNPSYEYQSIREYADELNLIILAIKIVKTKQQLSLKELKVNSLKELTPLDLFHIKLERENLESIDFKDKLLLKFKEIINDNQIFPIN
jgi:exonuclease SbcD